MQRATIRAKNHLRPFEQSRQLPDIGFARQRDSPVAHPAHHLPDLLVLAVAAGENDGGVQALDQPIRDNGPSFRLPVFEWRPCPGMDHYHSPISWNSGLSKYS